MERINIKIGAEELVLESGRMAKQANGAVFATYAGTGVLATACCSPKPNEELDYLPLHVEYNEKYYAAGKIPGGFIKRETRPKDKEILVSRLIDRPMRPLFPSNFKRDLQVIPTTISADQVNPPDIVAMNAASAAVVISDIPFAGPVGAVRIGYVNGVFIVNPTFAQIEEGTLDIVVAGTLAGITMVEGGGQEISEDVLIEAIDVARAPIMQLCEQQNKLRELIGKPKLVVGDAPRLKKHDDYVAIVRPHMEKACFVKGKMERVAAIESVKQQCLESFGDDVLPENAALFNELFETVEQDVMRRSIVKDKKRTDGRGPKDIRPITCEIDILTRTHGSALFTRGETQALAITTLGTVYDEQIKDDIEGDRREHFMLHYNFPPFSVGETGRLTTGRREIGHGHLAHRALKVVLPDKQNFPYTLRIVSEILESNGSSSMATVCSSSLSLMNAGIAVSKPVAGIAMGLVKEGDEITVISDILGEEDHFGDMDFKVAGTADGITAFQMDIKLENVDAAIMKEALEQAREGRLHILSVMNQSIEKPREQLSQYAPRIFAFSVDPEQIGALIGPSGKTIKGINDRYDVKTNIEDDGSVTIYCKEKVNGDQAKAAFLQLLEEPEIGRVYDGVVRRIVDFGAFIEFLPGKEGLCHISKMANYRVNSVEDILQINQSVEIKIIEIDKMGRVNLSLIYEGADDTPHRRFSRDDDRGDRGRGDRGRDDRGGGYNRDRRPSRNSNRRPGR